MIFGSGELAHSLMPLDRSQYTQPLRVYDLPALSQQNWQQSWSCTRTACQCYPRCSEGSLIGRWQAGTPLFLALAAQLLARPGYQASTWLSWFGEEPPSLPGWLFSLALDQQVFRGPAEAGQQAGHFLPGLRGVAA